MVTKEELFKISDGYHIFMTGLQELTPFFRRERRINMIAETKRIENFTERLDSPGEREDCG